ncbi:MAG TPA: hypothetical protein VGZ05_10735, partial [Steroidobacteraceae bacterium]|nr:hypothetical protein [Steroidobacteraceae bacterium]
MLDDRLLDGEAAEGLAEIAAAPLVGDRVRAVERVGEAAYRLLDPLHEITVVGVREVQLEHREFRIVLRREALVAEVAVDL